MNGILDFAIQLEKDGERYYRDMAAKTRDKGLLLILGKLADAEVKHQQVLTRMKERGEADMAADGVRIEAGNVFRRLAESGGMFDLAAPQLDVYRKAMEIELRSLQYYREKAGQAGSPAARDLLLKIAAEEDLHYRLLEGIVDFVSAPEPGKWLENAEWRHHDEY